MESMLTKLPQCGKYANKTFTMWKLNDTDNHISNLMSKDSNTDIWWAGMWHFDPKRSFKSQIDSKSSNFMSIAIEDANKNVSNIYV